MYKFFNLRNLQQVCKMSFDRELGTIKLWATSGRFGELPIDLSPDRSEDSKASGFTITSFQFMVRMIEQVTGYKFRPTKGLEFTVVVLERTTTRCRRTAIRKATTLAR